MKYKIFWIDASLTPKKVFPHYAVTQECEDGWTEVEAWDFIEAKNDNEAVQKTIDYINNNSRSIDVFAIIKNGVVIATEEDIDWDKQCWGKSIKDLTNIDKSCII